MTNLLPIYSLSISNNLPLSDKFLCRPLVGPQLFFLTRREGYQLFTNWLPIGVSPKFQLLSPPFFLQSGTCPFLSRPSKPNATGVCHHLCRPPSDPRESPGIIPSTHVPQGCPGRVPALSQRLNTAVRLPQFPCYNQEFTKLQLHSITTLYFFHKNKTIFHLYSRFLIKYNQFRKLFSF